MNEYRPYWVLKNKVKRYTRIHKSECGHCRNGEGPRPGHTGCWHGFESYEEARTWADSIGWPVHPCTRHTCQAVELISAIRRININNWSEWCQLNQQSLNTLVPESPGIYEIRTDYIFGRLKGYSQTVRIGKADKLKQRLRDILNKPDMNRTIEEKRLIQKGHAFEFRYAKAESGTVPIQMENEALAEYVMEYWELPPCIRNFPKEVVKVLEKEWKL